MARADRAAQGQRLYERFLAPLVLGGDLTPGPGVGAEAAFDLDGALVGVDRDLRSHVDMSRVRVARRLVAVDMLEGPSAPEWALAAALHDMVFALHPELDHILHRSAPDKLLTFAEQTIERVRAAESLSDEVSRYTFFARVLELHRTDIQVSWWTGHRTFLGASPPPRLLAWPDIRNVHTQETVVPLAALPNALAAARRERFFRVFTQWLGRVPLVDLATASRNVVPFEWTASVLGLFAATHGKVLGLRALALGPAGEVDTALGKATAPHVKAAAWENVARIGEVLAERALALATTDAEDVMSARELSEDASFARALGAALALKRVDTLGVSQGAARSITAKLMPLTRSVAAATLSEIVQQVGTLPATPAPAAQPAL